MKSNWLFLVLALSNPLIFGSIHSIQADWLYFQIELEGNDATIKWATTPDSNVSIFQVEKTIDERIYEVVGQIKPRSTQQEYHLYEFTDADMRSGLREGQVVHYRLKAIDQYGNVSHSVSRSLLIGKSEPVFKLMPNPATEELKIYFPPLIGEWRYLRILDQAGNPVYESTFHPEAPANLYIPLAGWGKGTYICQVQSENYSVYKKLVVR